MPSAMCSPAAGLMSPEEIMLPQRAEDKLELAETTRYKGFDVCLKPNIAAQCRDLWLAHDLDFDRRYLEFAVLKISRRSILEVLVELPSIPLVC